MRAKTALIACVVLLLFAISPGNACAIPIPPFTASENVSVSGNSMSASGFGTLILIPSPFPYAASSSAQTAGGSDPSVGAHQNILGAANPGHPVGSIGSNANVTYFFAVNGPAGTTAPIIVSSTGAANILRSVPGTLVGFGAGASLFITQQAGSSYVPFYNVLACAGDVSDLFNSHCDTAGPEPGSFNVTQTLLVEANTLYSVSIDAETTLFQVPLSNLPNGVDYFANAAVDPTIVLAPGVGSQYSISFSPGLTSVPEPNYLLLTFPALAGILLLTKLHINP